MALLLHLSDLHFGTEQAPVVAALQKLVHARRPDVLILSGDITQRAQADEFATARRFCDGLGVPSMLSLPGNHDIPLFNFAARLFAPYAAYMKSFGRDLEPVFDGRDVLVIGVNTTRRLRHKNGAIARAQIDRVVQRLQIARPEQLRVVVTHQPSAVMRAEDEHDRLRGGRAALDAWAGAGADLVLGGHIHLPYVLKVQTLWCVQAGTGVSSRVRHGTANSVNFLEWHPPEAGRPRVCSVERCDYDERVREFRTAGVRPLDLRGEMPGRGAPPLR